MYATFTPTPLPPSMLPTGPTKWNKERQPFATVHLTSKPDTPFVIFGKDELGRTIELTSPTLDYELYPNRNTSFDEYSSFDAALANAVASARSNEVVTGVFQAKEGEFYIRQFEAWAPRNADGDRKEGGKVLQEFPQFVNIDRPDAASVAFDKLNPDLVALVGARTWVDARNGATQTVATPV